MVLGMPQRKIVAALVAASLLGGGTGLLGGCSGEKAEAPPVATLQSAAAPAASSPAVNDDLRPLVRLDATDEEQTALVKVWSTCVQKEGGPGYEEPKMLFQYLADKDPKAIRVEAACHNKFPESYEERQRRKDIAAFRDNQRQWYRCAQQAGYKLTTPDEDGQFGITEIGPQGDFQSPGMENCRKEAFKD